MGSKCTHLEGFSVTHDKVKDYCEACAETGDSWVHLRTCQTCGVTLCCDSSQNKHATAHFKATGHEVIISAEPNEKWAWCYADEKIVRY